METGLKCLTEADPLDMNGGIDMSIPVRNFLKARRDRALGAIMGYAEREVFQKLSHEDQMAFRKVVLEALNSYHDSALDLFKSDVGTVHNEEVLTILTKIQESLDNR